MTAPAAGPVPPLTSAARGWQTAVVWFRRDLRVFDHPALSAAVDGARSVVPVFVVDERLLEGAGGAPSRCRFLAGSLSELAIALRARGSGLLLRSGRPESVVPELARETGAEVVLATAEVTPFGRRRDAAVAAALERDGRRLLLKPGLLLAEPGSMLTAAGSPYTVFTPFWRSLQRTPRRALLQAPERIDSPHDVIDDPSAALERLASQARPQETLIAPGEAAAQERLRRWLVGGLEDYGAARDRLDLDATSHLGADLHLGTLSPLSVETLSLEMGEAATPFVRQLAWREFYHHLLFHRDGSPTDGVMMATFRQEADDPAAVAAWREGRTGIPAVDAGMRQLAATSWMANRARLIVASFLTRHLLMDYRLGERHFLRHLIDGDVADNRGGWRWIAGIGSESQPAYRIMNPVLQGRRFDPHGTWVRRWVPELAGLPNQYIHAPWEMSEGDARDVGVRLGDTYPRPIVDLAAGRERALAAFRSARQAAHDL